MRSKIGLFLFVLLVLEAFFSMSSFPQDKGDSLQGSIPPKLTLVQSAMCEGLEEYIPKNPAIVFSISIGEVSCFTLFDPVPEKTFIFHKWFYRDKLSTKRKLYLKPSRWATLSSIQLREADKGPWRVEVTDKDDNIFQVLRFSITE
jgi:hypothetical protein